MAAFAVLSLPVKGDAAGDPRVQLVFSSVGRVVASLRLGHWNDPTAEVVKFPIQELVRVVAGFGGSAVYGWEFFDVHDKYLAQWAEHPSAEWRSGIAGMSHTIRLFQEGRDRHLDVCLWFDDFIIKNEQGQTVSIDDFVAGGRRWWEGLYRGDPGTSGHCIFPRSGEQTHP